MPELPVTSRSCCSHPAAHDSLQKELPAPACCRGEQSWPPTVCAGWGTRACSEGGMEESDHMSGLPCPLDDPQPFLISKDSREVPV